MSKQAVRTVCEPKYSVIKDRSSIADMLVRIRYKEVTRSSAGAKRAVKVDGVGNIVVAKRKTRLGSMKTVVMVNGRMVEAAELLKVLKSVRSKKRYRGK